MSIEENPAFMNADPNIAVKSKSEPTANCSAVHCSYERRRALIDLCEHIRAAFLHVKVRLEPSSRFRHPRFSCATEICTRAKPAPLTSEDCHSPFIDVAYFIDCGIHAVHQLAIDGIQPVRTIHCDEGDPLTDGS
jgi:hypothetical protein